MAKKEKTFFPYSMSFYHRSAYNLLMFFYSMQSFESFKNEIEFFITSFADIKFIGNVMKQR